MPAGHNRTSRVGTPQAGYTLGIRLPGSSWQLRLTGHPGRQLWTNLQVRTLIPLPGLLGPPSLTCPFPNGPPSWAKMEGERYPGFAALLTTQQK